MNIINYFCEAAKKYPNTVAIVHNRKAITYKELHEEVLKKSHALLKKGIKSGDTIMVMIPFSIPLYVNILALFYIGAKVVLVDAIKTKSKVVYAYQKATCSGIVSTKLIRNLRYFLFSPKLWGSFIQLKTTANPKVLLPTIVDQNQTALITFTTGTTGNPKAADRTHLFLTIQLQTLIDEMSIKPEDIHITSLPVVLMCNLAVGATSVIPPKKIFLQKNNWKYIRNFFSPNVISASPAHFITFNKNLKSQNYSRIFIGGSTILPHFAQHLNIVLGNKKVEFVYGSTEAEPIATLSNNEYLKMYKTNEIGICVGKPHKNIEVVITKINDPIFTILDEGELGEILVAGPHVLNNYFKDEEAFLKNKILHNDILWHKTGDAGYFSGGNLFFYGRIKYLWRENNKIYSPTVYEKFISHKNSIAEATLLHINGKNIVFATGISLKNLNIINTSFELKIDEVIFLKKIPRDTRHLSRIDYEKLLRLK